MALDAREEIQVFRDGSRHASTQAPAAPVKARPSPLSSAKSSLRLDVAAGGARRGEPALDARRGGSPGARRGIDVGRLQIRSLGGGRAHGPPVPRGALRGRHRLARALRAVGARARTPRRAARTAPTRVEAMPQVDAHALHLPRARGPRPRRLAGPGAWNAPPRRASRGHLPRRASLRRSASSWAATRRAGPSRTRSWATFPARPPRPPTASCSCSAWARGSPCATRRGLRSSTRVEGDALGT